MGKQREELAQGECDAGSALGHDLEANTGRVAPPSCDGTRPAIWQQVLAVSIFVVYHQDILHTHKVFRDVRFLMMAALLGISCQEALFLSGSIWPGVVMHC